MLAPHRGRFGTVVTLGHPVLAVPGVGVVRIEDTFLVAVEGDDLTDFPRQLICVWAEVELLRFA